MPTPKQRNSRDDKSRTSKSPKNDLNERKGSFKPKTTSKKADNEGGDRKSFRSSADRPVKSDRTSFGDRKPRSNSSYNRDQSSGEGAPAKRSYTKREDSGDRKPRSNSSYSRDQSTGEGAPAKRSYTKREDSGDRKPRSNSSYSRDQSTGEDAPAKRSYTKREDSGDRKPRSNSSYSRDQSSGEGAPAKRSYTKREDTGNRTPGAFGRSMNKDKFSGERGSTFKKPYQSNREGFGDRKPRENGPSYSTDRFKDDKKPFKSERDEFGERKPRSTGGSFSKDRYASERGYEKNYEPRKTREDKPLGGKGRKTPLPSSHDDGTIRLNRYISNAGICSRRKADELIAAGVVSVNGEVVSELGFRVNPAKDVIRYNGETLKREKMVYVLLNKPKDYITTTEDPQERRTVMHLVEKASKERIYPIGRLDRNTTGLLLMTNDGDLADKLSHPRNNISKIYQVELNKSLSQGDLNKINFGLELEDGFIKPDEVTYVQGASKKEIGIQIHSGKNRIVRRIFEHLGYEVVKLDRVVYANLTKKDLTRGRWRYLDEKEVIQLKHLIK